MTSTGKNVRKQCQRDRRCQSLRDDQTVTTRTFLRHHNMLSGSTCGAERGAQLMVDREAHLLPVARCGTEERDNK